MVDMPWNQSKQMQPNWMWSNEIYFSILSPFYRCCVTWISLVNILSMTNVTSSYELFSLLNFLAHLRCGYSKKLTAHHFIGCLSIHGTRVTSNNFTNNNVFFFVSDLKILFYNPRKREEYYFASLLTWRQK